MNNNTWTAIGKVFFALAILCIGIIHLVTKNFPTGLLPAPEIPHKIILVYVSGVGLIVAGLLIMSNKFTHIGAWLSFAIWVIALLAIHLPIVIADYKNGGEWAVFFEVIMLIAGSMLLIDTSRTAKKNGHVLAMVARYLFALAMLVFAVQHYMYAQYIATLITPWIPFKLFFSYLVGVAFLAVAISIIINRFMQPAAITLGVMFLLWFFILHLPRVLAHQHTEAEWTSLFVVLASGGEAFLIAGSVYIARKSKRYKN